MRFAWYATMVATLAVAMGCEGNISTTTPGTEMSAAPAPPEPMPPGDPAQAAATAEAETADEGASAPAAEVAGEPAAEPAAQVAEVPADEPADSAADGDAEVATAESGAKGRDYQPGLITTPIQEYFRAEGAH